MDSKLTNLNVAHDDKKHELKEDIQNLKSSLKESQTSLYKAIGDVKNMAQVALNQSLKALKDKSENGQENLIKYTKEHPVKTACYAFLAGAVLAKLFQFGKNR